MEIAQEKAMNATDSNEIIKYIYWKIIKGRESQNALKVLSE